MQMTAFKRSEFNLGKRLEKDGKVYRMRRGEWVEIPPEWVGKTLSHQTKNKRPSKQLHKHRKMTKYGVYNHNYHKEKNENNDY